MPSSKKANNIPNVLPPRTKEEKLAAIFGPASTSKKKAQPARTKAQKLAAIHHGTSSTPVVGHGAKNKTLQQIKSEQREKLRLAQEWAVHGNVTTTNVNHAKTMKTPQEIKLVQREKIRLAQEWAKEQQRGLEQEERWNDEVIRRASSNQTTTTTTRASAAVKTTPSRQRVLRPTSSTLETRASPAPSVYVIFGTLIGM